MDITDKWSEATLERDDVREYVAKHADAEGYVPGDQDVPGSTIDHITNTLYGLYESYQRGRTLGDFQEALVLNDLNKAVTHADKKNLVGIKISVMFLYNAVPQGAWESLKDRAKKQKASV